MITAFFFQSFSPDVVFFGVVVVQFQFITAKRALAEEEGGSLIVLIVVNFVFNLVSGLIMD